MLVLQDCINKLADFKAAFSQKYGIINDDLGPLKAAVEDFLTKF